MLGFATKKDIHEYVDKRHDEILKEWSSLALKVEKNPTLTSEYDQRLADLEVKMAKLWGLLVETTPTGKEKLGKFGKRFGGQSKQFL